MTFDQNAQSLYLLPETTDRAICLLVEGQTKKEHYIFAGKLCDEMFQRSGDIRMLLLCRNFTGWDEETSRMDMGFSLEFGGRMSRLALVNPPPAAIALFKVKEGLHKREVRYFPEEEFADAVAWLNE